MKDFPFGIVAVIAFTVSIFPQPAKALPFKTNCASMQSYFNALSWNNPTFFQGFEPNKIIHTKSEPTAREPYELAKCSPGYMTETSPMGTKVCKGEISYVKHIGPTRLNFYTNPTVYSECRYK